MNRAPYPSAILCCAFSILAAAPLQSLAQSAGNPSPEEQETAGAAQGAPSPAGEGGKHDSHDMHMHHPETLIEQIEHHGGSGTSVQPISTPHEMLMTTKRGWMLMFHGVAFLNEIQQTGPRGFDKLFSTNWLMPMAQRELGPGTLTIRTMLSLEPATITERRFPELFQQGETAFGVPLVDGQHPHNFFMELAGLYDWKPAPDWLVSFYAAPMGDPALGPTAYPHRASAGEDPLATLSHHLQDSTHISLDVFTLGVTYKVARVEVSGFHGREPDEHRWRIDTGAVDSWSARLTLSPAQNWSGQFSLGRIHSREALSPLGTTFRMTASLAYNRPLEQGNWATTLVWGRNLELPDHEVFNSYLAESTLRFARQNSVWTRAESVDRTNELLLGEVPLPSGFQEHFLARVQAYSIGYDRDFYVVPHLAAALGAQATVYSIPAVLHPTYGAQPAGVVLFLRVRPTAEKN